MERLLPSSYIETTFSLLLHDSNIYFFITERSKNKNDNCGIQIFLASDIMDNIYWSQFLFSCFSSFPFFFKRKMLEKKQIKLWWELTPWSRKSNAKESRYRFQQHSWNPRSYAKFRVLTNRYVQNKHSLLSQLHTDMSMNISYETTVNANYWF